MSNLVFSSLVKAKVTGVGRKSGKPLVAHVRAMLDLEGDLSSLENLGEAVGAFVSDSSAHRLTLDREWVHQRLAFLPTDKGILDEPAEPVAEIDGQVFGLRLGKKDDELLIDLKVALPDTAQDEEINATLHDLNVLAKQDLPLFLRVTEAPGTQRVMDV